MNLDDPRLLLADGLAPSERDPRFHQQMVYAVISALLENFELGLGQRFRWRGKQRLRAFLERLRALDLERRPTGRLDRLLLERRAELALGEIDLRPLERSPLTYVDTIQGALFELVADTVPDQLALAHGRDGVTRSWAEVEQRTNALACHLSSRHQPGDKLAIYSYNRPEYVESVIAALKARLAPVNVNYRYREEELLYLFDNADATAVVYEAGFAPLVAALRDRLPRVRDWIELDDGSPGNAFARHYEELAGGNAQRLAVQRSPDDLLLLYTGESISTTFVITAGAFGGMALYGTMTGRSLSAFGQFLFIGLIGVVLASIVGMFWHNDELQFILSVVGVIVFAGLAAYDAQRLKVMALSAPEGPLSTYAVVGALALYLDFINLFLFLLRFTGNRRR